VQLLSALAPNLQSKSELSLRGLPGRGANVTDTGGADNLKAALRFVQTASLSSRCRLSSQPTSGSVTPKAERYKTLEFTQSVGTRVDPSCRAG